MIQNIPSVILDLVRFLFHINVPIMNIVAILIYYSFLRKTDASESDHKLMAYTNTTYALSYHSCKS
jgi:hypothetical protein